MTATIIDGKEIAARLREEYKLRVGALARRGLRPGLAVVMVGDNPASKVYVANKIKACRQIGLHSEVHEFLSDVGSDEVLARIRGLNADRMIHGIIVQLPLPAHLDTRSILESIESKKDVDGFNQYNVGALVIGNTVFPPCTPYAVQALLAHSDIPVEGRNVVVVGASNVVGKPLALMLLAKEATVTICHIKTRDLAQLTILADILVVAAGKPNLITGPMVRTGAVVIDVGINRLPDGRLVGDVDFEAVIAKASHITPVPGGVGPMTVTMLLGNTLSAAEREAPLNASAGVVAPFEEVD